MRVRMNIAASVGWRMAFVLLWIIILWRFAALAFALLYIHYLWLAIDVIVIFVVVFLFRKIRVTHGRGCLIGRSIVDRVRTRLASIRSRRFDEPVEI